MATRVEAPRARAIAAWPVLPWPHDDAVEYAHGVDEFAASVRARFGPRMAALVLFGSQARSDASEDSDVDILVVIDDLSQEDAREIDALVGDVLTQRDVLLSPLVMGTARWRELRARARRLVAEIDREGVPL